MIITRAVPCAKNIHFCCVLGRQLRNMSLGLVHTVQVHKKVLFGVAYALIHPFMQESSLRRMLLSMSVLLLFSFCFLVDWSFAAENSSVFSAFFAFDLEQVMKHIEKGYPARRLWKFQPWKICVPYFCKIRVLAA